MVYFIIYKILDIFFQGVYLALLLRVLLSWFPHNRMHPLVEALYNVTDPILEPFRNIIPSMRFGVDLSPIFAFIALSIIRKFIFQLLF